MFFPQQLVGFFLGDQKSDQETLYVEASEGELFFSTASCEARICYSNKLNATIYHRETEVAKTQIFNQDDIVSENTMSSVCA